MALSACLAMLLLAACGGEDGGDAPTLAGPLVYERSGGSTGDKSRVTLQPNGRATFATARRALQPQTDGQYGTELVDERSVKLDPAELERVSRQLAEVDFAQLPARLLAPGEPIPDSCCGHTVTYQDESVYADDEVEPAKLGALTITLSLLFERYAAR